MSKIEHVIDFFRNHPRFRFLNLNAYTKQLQTTTNKIIDRLINVFDSWMTRAVLGQARLKTLVVQLRQIKKVANKQIEMVMKDLQLAHKKALATPYPNTTAKAPIHTPGGSKKPNSTSAPCTQQNGQVFKNTRGNTANTGTTNTSTKRQSKKRSNKELGSGGEHITDYYFVKRKKSRSKINNNGVLYEYHDTDHAWYSNSIGP